jgi:hypothetical protein
MRPEGEVFRVVEKWPALVIHDIRKIENQLYRLNQLPGGSGTRNFSCTASQSKKVQVSIHWSKFWILIPNAVKMDVDF